MPVENSQFHGRLSHPLSVAGSCCVTAIACPKVGESNGPHSPLPSVPVSLVKSQSAMLLWFASATFTAELVENDEPGLSASAVAIVSPATPRAAEALIAVLPLPNRS